MEADPADVGPDRHHVPRGVVVDDAVLNVVDPGALYACNRRDGSC